MTGRIFWVLLFLVSSLITSGSSWIRINQMGYLPQSVKVAVFISDESTDLHQFQLVDAISNKVVFESLPVSYDGSKWGMKSAARLNFSKFSKEGNYYLKAGNSRSAEFTIAPDVFKGSADYILNYMRQQRCGYNPPERFLPYTRWIYSRSSFQNWSNH